MRPKVTQILAITASLTLLLLSSFYAEARASKKSFLASVQSELASAPQDNEVCFSPVDPCAAKLVKFIDSATSSIDIAIYDINLDQVGHALLVKSKSVKIRMVVDQRQSKEKNSIVPLLLKAGINLKIGHQRGIMHNKFTIIDGKRIETGSFNYTNHASEANNENQIYLSTPSIVSRYKDRFEEIWREARD